MKVSPQAGFALEPFQKARNLVCVFIATGLFLLKGSYSGPLHELVHAYGGNVSVSFALFFVFRNLSLPERMGRVLPAVIVLVVVELFEIMDGFGYMVNTYDPYDLIANAVGVVLGFWLDIALTGKRTRSDREEHRRSRSSTNSAEKP